MARDHVCKWAWNNDLVIPFICSEPDCRSFLDHDQSEIRITATERLEASNAALLEALERIASIANTSTTDRLFPTKEKFWYEYARPRIEKLATKAIRKASQ